MTLPEHALRRLLADATPLLDGVGDRVGKYRLVRELGRGGMGVVYEALDEELNRRVALKVLALPPGGSAPLRERFEREALAAARLNHPNIAAVYEATGEAIAMQLVDGVPLSMLPRDDVGRLVRLVRDAARAVHYAHEQGIVHRDLKPHNLMVEGERVVVTDFGLAKETSVESSLSMSGHVLGSPGYMAPEQAEGRVRDVDPRTDVWGLGATLYDLLTGRPPFVERDVVVLLRRIVEEDPPALRALVPDVPRDLETVVLKCLAKERERRYVSAAALADDLTRWLDGEPVLAQPPSIGYRVSKFVRRRPAAVAAGLSAVAVLVALTFWLHERAQGRATGQALRLSEQAGARLEDARTFIRLGEIERAHEHVDRGLEECARFLAEHDVAEAHLLMARLLRARSRDEEAMRSLDRALERDPDLLEARLGRGILGAYILTLELGAVAVHDVDSMEDPAREQRRRALDDLEASVASASRLRRVDALHARAEQARLSGELDIARELLDEVLRLDPVRVEARLALSRVELAEDRGGDAWALALAALDIPRGYGPAYVAQATPTPDAVTAPETVRLPGVIGELFDFVPGKGTASPQTNAYAQRAVGHARAAADRALDGDVDGALASWRESVAQAEAALTLEPDLATVRSNLGVFLFARSRALVRAGRLAEAETVARAAVEALEAAAAAAPGDTVIRANRDRIVGAAQR